MQRPSAIMLGCIVAFSGGTAILTEAAARDEPLARAAAYLWSQQADDGGWHSSDYAVLRSGQALTPFILHALLQVPETICARPEGGVARALDFIREHVDEQGALGRADPEILEYPVYSTAYAVQCLAAASHLALDETSDRQLVSKMAGYLIAAQFDESEGFATTHAAYGGWGFDVANAHGEPGHMDLAHTRRAVEALRKVVPLGQYSPRTDVRHPSFTRAELFLRVVQRDPGALAVPPRVGQYLHSGSSVPFDGGFYFSPIVQDANKGRFSATLEGKAAPHFRSYATATCDGILALLACGVSRDDERLIRAAAWLRRHDDPDYPHGIPIDHPEPWGAALRFYHYAVRAEAYAALDWPGEWRRQLTNAVARHQTDTGSFRNTASPLMKEDDPLLCTALAVVALASCLEEDRMSGR